MSRPLLRSLLPLIAVTVGACAPLARGGTGEPAVAGPSLSTQQFGALIEGLSEPGGYFPSDNFVSNETSYLHVLGTLRDLGVRGGAYVGVGPDQGFSYIAAIRPEIAFIVDIRRANLLQHFLFKAAFANSPNRLAYLAFMLGKPQPADLARWDTASIEDIVRYIDSAPSDPEQFGANAALARQTIERFGHPLSASDWADIARIHHAFFQAGLEIRYSNRGRFGIGRYPSWRQLIFESDLEGTRRNYLATEESFRYVKDLERRNLIVPVVGDLSGPHALAAIGRELATRGLSVSALYTSNVEQYLFQQGGFNRFAESVIGLPFDERSVIIRSFFRGRHPLNIPGYASTQLVERIADFATEYRAGGYRSYLDVVMKNVLPPRR